MHDELSSRHLFTADLVLDTALHLGGGAAAARAHSDSPVYRDQLGLPLIPGSSMKGAFRSAVERLAHSLSHDSTALVCGGPGLCLPPDELQKQKKVWERQGLPQAKIDEELYLFLLEKLCYTCLLFGYQSMAGRTLFADLPLAEGEVDPGSEIRDGVAIDRDSGTAVPHLKFDYEVIPAGTRFAFRLIVENVANSDQDLGLLAVGLRELENGMVPLGGMRTRGLGRCHLEGLTIRVVNLTDRRELLTYLVKGIDGMTTIGGVRQALDDWITKIV